MANEIQIAALKEGVEVWNRWRRDSLAAKIDLNGANLCNAYLRNANLISANLISANLISANLISANLRNTNLLDANLNGADLLDADLSNANLNGADLRDADLSNANLNGADLIGAIISEETRIDDKWKLVHQIVNIDGTGQNPLNVDFLDANLHSIDLSNANLHSIDLRNANLCGIILRDANLGNANLSNAFLRNANLSNAFLRNANLSNADLSNADLSKTSLRNANLSNTDLSNTSLRNANLSGANLCDANLNGANLRNVFLNGANLNGANLNEADLNGANITEKTRMDDKWKLVHQIVNVGGIGKNLLNADFSNSDLHSVDLSNANLSDANFSSANLNRANLKGANLKGANLKGANLLDVKLEEANLREVEISEATRISPKLRLVHELLNEGAIGKDLTGADLSGVNLSRVKFERVNLLGANLEGADLSRANLYGANLKGANLKQANLSRATLYGANLSKTKFTGANLSRVNLRVAQCLNAIFKDSTLSGACISDWHINDGTNFQNVQCDHIYRSYDSSQLTFSDRLPVNQKETFKPGEFENWITIQAEARKTIDLTFPDGIDWQSFFQSLQRVRQQYPDSGVNLQAIEKKGSAFVIRLETTPNADKGAIESLTTELYETQMKLSKAEGKIEILMDMNQTLEKLAGQGMDKPTYQTNNNAQTIGVLHSGSGNVSHFTQNIRTQTDDIVHLIKSLRELSQSFPQEQHEIVEQQEIINGELEDLEHDLKTLEDYDPERLGRKLKRLRNAGATVLAIASTAVASGMTFTDNANSFIENVDKLGEKIGIEVIQDKSPDE